jgi:hypothetical protein
MRTIVALAATLLVGCATVEERYLTKEQDDEMRQHCAESGCTVIPNAQWNMIERILQQLGLSPS